MQHESHISEILELSKLGFATNPLNKVFEDLELLYNYSLEIEKTRIDLNYPIDGLVVKLVNNNTTTKLGIIGKTPRTWCAIKFAPDEVTSKVVNVTFQIGRTGKLTPVAELTPTSLQGSIVSRATLHNVAELKNKNLCINDTVVLRKAGDIIPEIVQVLTDLRPENSFKVEIPTDCPCCGSKLELNETNIDLFCLNTIGCKDQIILRLAYYTTRNIANIEGLSQKTIEKLVYEFNVRNIADLYTIDLDLLLKIDGFGEKSITSLKNSILKASKIKDFKLITGLGINGLGSENAKILAKFIDNLHYKKI